MMGTRPQTIGYGLSDSPAGLAAWMLGHPGFANWSYRAGDPEKSFDEVLDDITLYWLTNSATSSARLYWENGGQSVILAAAQKTAEISLPVAITVFPGEIYRAPESWARRAYRNLIYFNEADQRRTLRGMGTSRAVQQRNSRRVQAAPSLELRPRRNR